MCLSFGLGGFHAAVNIQLIRRHVYDAHLTVKGAGVELKWSRNSINFRPEI